MPASRKPHALLLLWVVCGCMAYRHKSECDNLSPVSRRSLLESAMRTPTTRFEVTVVVVFFIAIVAGLVYFLPGFLGLH
jgi:hypothetical protein